MSVYLLSSHEQATEMMWPEQDIEWDIQIWRRMFTINSNLESSRQESHKAQFVSCFEQLNNL